MALHVLGDSSGGLSEAEVEALIESGESLPSSVVSSSRYDAEAEEWEPRPSANVVIFSSADKEAATPGDIQAGDLIVRATE